MKTYTKIHFFITGIMLVLLLYVFYKQYNTKKIVVVNPQMVVEKYDGFKEAQDIYESKIKEMQTVFEEQKKHYESKSNEIKILSDNLSDREMEVKKGELKILEAKIIRLGKSIEEKTLAKEQELLQGVYNKINDFVKRYAESNKLDIIEGVTNSGNIMYASETTDITQEIINGLNKEYVEGITE